MTAEYTHTPKTSAGTPNYSTLQELCTHITSEERKVLDAGHRLGNRLVCPEYSKSVQEVKTYPVLNNERIFALCWKLDGNSVIHATMCPAPEHFSYSRTFTPGEKTQLHTHDYIELAYVVEGEFRQRILGNDIVFRQGELCLVDKNCLHQDYLLENSATVLFLGIANDMFAEIMDENVATEKIISFLQSALLKQKDVQQYVHFKPGNPEDKRLENCIHMLLSELYDGNAGSVYLRKGLLLRIFWILSTGYEFSLSREQQKTMNWIIFEEVSRYIQEHFTDITIQDLTRTFHFQEDYFNRLIKNKTGLTYSAYVQKLRLEKAERLLTHSDKTVDEIIEIAGYHNKGYFYKIFREKYHMTPSQYRKTKESGAN